MSASNQGRQSPRNLGDTIVAIYDDLARVSVDPARRTLEVAAILRGRLRGSPGALSALLRD